MARKEFLQPHTRLQAGVAGPNAFWISQSPTYHLLKQHKKRYHCPIRLEMKINIWRVTQVARCYTVFPSLYSYSTKHCYHPPQSYTVQLTRALEVLKRQYGLEYCFLALSSSIFSVQLWTGKSLLVKLVMQTSVYSETESPNFLDVKWKLSEGKECKGGITRVPKRRHLRRLEKGIYVKIFALKRISMTKSWLSNLLCYFEFWCI